MAYRQDCLERTVLFWDALRQRGSNMLEHERAGLPPLLGFKYEILLDARCFDRPANYALVRITEVGEDCWDDCVETEEHTSELQSLMRISYAVFCLKKKRMKE